MDVHKPANDGQHKLAPYMTNLKSVVDDTDDPFIHSQPPLMPYSTPSHPDLTHHEIPYNMSELQVEHYVNQLHIPYMQHPL